MARVWTCVLMLGSLGSVPACAPIQVEKMTAHIPPAARTAPMGGNHRHHDHDSATSHATTLSASSPMATGSTSATLSASLLPSLTPSSSNAAATTHVATLPPPDLHAHHDHDDDHDHDHHHASNGVVAPVASSVG